MTPQEAIDKHGLTIESRFVPFSRSRNKAEKNKSLNWSVTLRKNGREVLTTDYSAGVAHCPAYQEATKGKPFGRGMSVDEQKAIDLETETGKTHGKRGTIIGSGKPITPDSVNVIWCLIMDSGVLYSGGFEDWAADYGYDPDSRNAESIYRQCLESALKLQASLGAAALDELREAFQDY